MSEIHQIPHISRGKVTVVRPAGAVDCTHVPIQSPGGLDAEIYQTERATSLSMCSSSATVVAASWMLEEKQNKKAVPKKGQKRKNFRKLELATEVEGLEQPASSTKQ